MIISHRHKFIFIKTGKTAGTSIEVALSQICGPDDICTPLGKRLKGRSSRPGEEALEPRNWQGFFLPAFGPGIPLAQTRREMKDAMRGKKFYNHIPAELVRRRVGRPVFDSYYKFCFERNPWDKAVSAFNWERTRLDVPQTFEDWLAVRKPPSQVGRYSVDGKIAMDRIGRYETLAEDFRSILEAIGVETIPELPRTKSGFRKEKKHYREYYTDETRDIVARTCAREIELFGYEF